MIDQSLIWDAARLANSRYPVPNHLVCNYMLTRSEYESAAAGIRRYIEDGKISHEATARTAFI